MNATASRWIVAAGVSLVSVTLLAPPAAASGDCLAPNGIDDTDALQSELDRCSGADGGCAVRLCAGLFQTAPLRVGDFRGSLRGAGSADTVIRALPDLQVNDNPNGYWQDHPLDPALDPWPYLLQFVGGQATVSALSIEIPSPPVGGRPTTGWTEFPGFVNEELAGAILATGQHPMRLKLTRLEIVSDEYVSDLGPTPALLAGVSLRGLVFNPDDPSEFPVHPLTGHAYLGTSALSGMLVGVDLGELEAFEVTIRRTHTEAFVGVSVLDATASRVRALGNLWKVDAVGFQAFLNIDGDPSENNWFLLVGNRAQVGPFFGAGTGIVFQDPVILPGPGSSTVRVFGNHLELGTDAEPAFAGMDIVGPGRLVVGWNTLRGRVLETGIGIDETSGCQVLLNEFGGLEAGPGSDLHLRSGANDCRAVVFRDDEVLDDGTENRVLLRRGWRPGGHGRKGEGGEARGHVPRLPHAGRPSMGAP